ncbi:MAG: hypothetical protein AAFN59_02300 [Pseudomonadota bacterium]
MKRTFFAIMASALVGTLAFAATMEDMDADTDGLVTYDEITAIYPDVTQDAFALADTNADGMIDAEELAAAQDAGVLPPAS